MADSKLSVQSDLTSAEKKPLGWVRIEIEKLLDMKNPDVVITERRSKNGKNITVEMKSPNVDFTCEFAKGDDESASIRDVDLSYTVDPSERDINALLVNLVTELGVCKLNYADAIRAFDYVET